MLDRVVDLGAHFLHKAIMIDMSAFLFVPIKNEILSESEPGQDRCQTDLVLSSLSDRLLVLGCDRPQSLLLVRHLLLAARRLFGGVELGLSLRHDELPDV